MFDPQFRLSPDLIENGSTSDEAPSSSNTWQQLSLDELFQQHDLTPAMPIHTNDSTNNDLWASAQFNEFFNNYRQQQQPRPIDISSLISSSPPQQSLPVVDNHIFEPEQSSFNGYPSQYSYLPSENNRMAIRRESLHQTSAVPPNRQRQLPNIQQQQQQRILPVLQVPNDDYYQQQSSTNNPKFKQNQPPSYVACLNHGINYNGVSGPPILLPPSF